jgi:hypothetical protein
MRLWDKAGAATLTIHALSGLLLHLRAGQTGIAYLMIPNQDIAHPDAVAKATIKAKAVAAARRAVARASCSVK